MYKSKFLPLMTLMIAATLIVSSNSKAAETSPGEGYYTGLFLGHGTGIIQAEVNLFASTLKGNRATTLETERGGLGLSGIQGGGWLGWGMKTADDLYFGTEISFAGSDEKIELTSSRNLAADNQTAITSATAKRNWVGGGSLRAGYYVNSNTLLALSGGIAVSQFDVSIGSDTDETFYAGGPQMGASLETKLSKIDPNLGLRMEFVYTNYLTAETNGIDGGGVNSVGTSSSGNDSELTGHDTAGRIGITYNF
jgi:hypothetical protein